MVCLIIQMRDEEEVKVEVVAEEGELVVLLLEVTPIPTM